jgi:hypothetical protein
MPATDTIAARVKQGESEAQARDEEPLACPYCGKEWTDATLNPRDRAIHHKDGCLLILFTETIIRDFQFPYWNRFARASAAAQQRIEDMKGLLQYLREDYERLAGMEVTSYRTGMLAAMELIIPKLTALLTGKDGV